MAFVVTTKQMNIGGGTPSVYLNTINTNTNTGAANVQLNINAATGYSPNAYISFGRLRVKSNVVGANATSKVQGVWLSDGTNTRQVYIGDPAATANGAAFDYTYDNLTSDLLVNQIIVQINVANNNGTADIEFCGT